jgi:GTP diphosphokinase / guanosine-3',5'-bis(diphosphate) 3'-diphosphatase
VNNPLSQYASQIFGEYPKQFNELLEIILIGKNIEEDKNIKELLWKAYEFGSFHHNGQKRRSGEPYFSHCLAVAETLAKWKMDSTTIIAGLLHDTIEDTEATLDELKDMFGEDLSNLVDGVTKLGEFKFSSRQEKQAGNFMKMLISVAQDLRVIIIKFADRLHNMKTIKYMPVIKRHRIATETRDVYVPLAHRLGMSTVKAQLEDLVFQVLNPSGFKQIENKIKSTRKEREKFINRVIIPIKKEISKYDIGVNIYGRAKSYSSIYGKIIERNKVFNEIYDLYAIRIIVEKIENCYLALGIVHSIYTPMQDRFKDFIANPKSNGYQSVHTTVFGPNANMIEIQIRTKEMEETAEIGIAAHWVYKNNESSKIDEKVKWLRELLDILKSESTDPKEFMDILKIDLYNEQIFVFTPKGDLIQLPVGSTTVDFAFQVHTQIGIHCMGSKVNHKIVPLNTKLKNGDMVEVLRSKKEMPSYGWRKFIITSKARNEVNRYLKNIQDKECFNLGEELLEKTLRRLKIYKELDEFKNSFIKFGYSDKTSLIKAIGSGNITVRDMLKKIRPKEIWQDDYINKKSKNFFNFSTSKDKGIIIDGIDNLMVGFGKCCNPIPGDSLIGFITRGRGVTVHNSFCKNFPLINHEKDRLVSLDWDVKSSDQFNVDLKVVGQDYKGWLKDLSECIAKQNININSVDIRVNDSIAEAKFIVEVNNKRQLSRLIRKIKKLTNIDYVERIGQI